MAADMINVVIVDDEATGVEVLGLMLENYCSNVTVSGIASGTNDAVTLINQLKPELIFLDVELKDGSGFDILEQIQHRQYEVIFVTAYDNYAIKAFKKRAVDYLLKPIDVEELRAAVELVAKRISTNHQLHEAVVKPAPGENSGMSQKKLSFPTSSGVIFLTPEEITYLRSESNYTGIYLNNKSKLLVSKTLKHVAPCFSAYNYLRVHHSYMVNMDEVVKYIKGDGGTIILKTGEKIPVSRASKPAVIKNLNLL
jgi:two-component system LytT family response regulator